MKISFLSNYRRPFTLAVTFHLLLLILLLFRWHFDETAKTPSAANEIVQATLVSAQPTPEAPKPEPAPLVEKIPIPPILENKPIEPQKKPVVEETVPDQPKQNHPPVLTTDSESEKKAAVEKKTKEEPKKVVKKTVEEDQKKLQMEMQNQLEAEQQQEKIKKAKQQQKELEKLLQKDLAETSVTKASSSKNKSLNKTASSVTGIDNKEIDRYKTLITAAISHRWVVPETQKKNLECHLKVRVAPGGTVITVQTVKSSGDMALDHSAETAVYKASPLPVPKDSALFNEFREFNLVVRPEGILAE